MDEKEELLRIKKQLYRKFFNTEPIGCHMNLGNYLTIDEQYLNAIFQMIMADNKQASKFKTALWERMEQTAGELVPKDMEEPFYRGMISALFSMYRIVPYVDGK